MLIDLHNHTPFCNHATGNPEEYIQKAIEKGIDVYGFADHAPMNFDPKYRMKFEEMDKYEQKIISLSQNYDNIKILLGYEVDFTPSIDKRVLERKVDYLIGSVHFLDNWGFDNPEFIGQWESRDIDDIYKEYFEAISAMARSGLFDIVGHFDLIKVFKFLPKADIRVLAKDALKEIKSSGMTLEINSAGLRKPIGEAYPSKSILELAYEMDIPITFGSDAHSVEQVGFGYDEVLALAKDVGYSQAVTFTNRDAQLIKI